MAAKEPDSQPQRKWAPATVGVCHWQTATDRFGPEAKAAIRDRERIALGLHPLGQEAPFLWTPETFDGDSVDEHSIYNTVPATQFYRNNLTALSQTYNLYFVAYQSHIFVYVPRCIARQRLPKRPDCRLRCEPSSVAPYVGGHVDRIVPHSVNNLVTGFLGSKEIVVACCDDGEVYAYYTKEIVEWISIQDKSPLAHLAGPRTRKLQSEKPPAHFFRENVGDSAWGLAVHRQSRLIAVSSNRREVTVFAFALKTVAERSDLRKQDHSERDGQAAFVRRRTKNWRIILALGSHADNIPNICFIDDNKGEAEKVSAIDINGFTWIAKIWAAGQPVVRIEPLGESLLRSEESIGECSRGWGILALPDYSFLTVDTVEELLGGTSRTFLPEGKASLRRMADVEPCVRAIPENPCPEINSGLDRAHNLNVLLPGQDALHAIANLLGTVNAQLGDVADESDASVDDPFIIEADAETDEDDDEDAEEGGVGVNELGMAAWAAAEMDLDDEIDETDEFEALWTWPWAGEDSLEETPLNDVVNEASLPAEPTPPPSLPQTWNLTPWSFTTKPRLPTPSMPTASSLKWREMGRHLVYYPHSGHIAPMPEDTITLAGFLKQSRQVSGDICNSFGSTSRGYHLVRTYEKDLEMRPLEHIDIGGKREIGIYCPNTLTLGSFQDRTVRPFFRATSRMSLVLHVPELSLVIIGSPMGRVLLLTPTRLASPQSAATGYWSHGLRVEWVLPRMSDDICHGHHRRPLHGIAVGPVQDERGAGGRGSQHDSIPHRYRLMLHYRNHDIATFELTRPEQTGKLCLF